MTKVTVIACFEPEEWLNIKQHLKQHSSYKEELTDRSTYIHFEFNLDLVHQGRLYSMLQVLAGLDMPMNYNQDITFTVGKVEKSDD